VSVSCLVSVLHKLTLSHIDHVLNKLNCRENITFVEEGCRGPGANKSNRVKWMKHLSQPELNKFLNISFIDEEGWISKLPTTVFS